MKFGLNFFPLSPRTLFPVTEAADRLGFESVWLGEHVVIPTHIESRHPFNPELGPPLPTTPIFDPLILIGHLAARTRQIRFGTAVYLNMLRHPIEAARLATTADIVSGGRLMLGVGAAWLKEEFDALGIGWERRGSRLDENIAVMRRLWTEEAVAHDGEFYAFDAVGFAPKPSNGTIPIHIGGENPAALKRAARTGDGWVGGINTPEEAAAKIATLKSQMARETAPEITVTHPGVPDRDDIERYRDAGVDRVCIFAPNLASSSPRKAEVIIEGMERFALETLRL